MFYPFCRTTPAFCVPDGRISLTTTRRSTMTKFSSSDGKSEVGDEASAIFNAVEDATYEVLRGMQQKGDEQQPHHLYVVLTAAAAAIQIAAKIMSAPHDKTHEEFMAWVEEPT